MHKGGTLGQLKLSTRRPSSGRCRPQTTSANNDVPRLAAHLLRPTTCPTPSRGRKEEARATTSGTRGRRACGGTTSRTVPAQSGASRERPRPPRRRRPRPTVVANQRGAVQRGQVLPGSRQQRLVAWAARPFETARGAVRETSPAGMAHYITRRGLSLVAFWHLLSPRRRLDLAASHHRPLPCPVALLSSPSFAPATHRTAGPLARVPGVRDGRVSAPYFEPSWATLGRVHRPAEHRAWATQTRLRRPARPARSIVPPPQRQWRAWGGRRRPRSPSWGCPPLSSHRSPPPVAPHALVPPQGRKAARSALSSAHLTFTPATATKEVASAAQMKPMRLVWEPHAVPLSPALLTTPKPTPRSPSRPSLTSWWLASTEPSSFLTPCPRSNSRRPTSDHKKGPRVLRGPASD